MAPQRGASLLLPSSHPSQSPSSSRLPLGLLPLSPIPWLSSSSSLPPSSFSSSAPTNPFAPCAPRLTHPRSMQPYMVTCVLISTLGIIFNVAQVRLSAASWWSGFVVGGHQTALYTPRDAGTIRSSSTIPLPPRCCHHTSPHFINSSQPQIWVILSERGLRESTSLVLVAGECSQ